MTNEAGPWLCFFCGELITNHEDAVEHFGDRDRSYAVCTYSVTDIRKMELDLARYHEEDTDADREIHQLRALIETQKRRAEELGYSRGLDDAKKFPETIGLQTVEHQKGQNA